MSANTKKYFIKFLTVIGVLIVINVLSHFAFHRFDLTSDKRYTLSKTSVDIVEQITEPLVVDVFLKGNFPSEFRKLQIETQQLLEEFKAKNRNVTFQFINPLENESERDSVMSIFMDRGLTPMNVTVEDKGKQSQEIIFPWAIATYKDKSIKIPLLKNVMAQSTAEKVVGSVQHLEYAFANGFNAVVETNQKKVAIMKGNGEMHDLLIADFVKQVRENYHIGTFTLDSVAKNPQKSLEYLKKYDLAIFAKPVEKFTDEEKMVIDQYIVGGGKTIFMIDRVSIEMDSLYNESGSTLAFPLDLNLDEMFFKYGVRINPTLVKDLMAAPIALATGRKGSETQYTQFPWFLSPIIYPTSKHPIASNLDGIKLDFANGIDTLKNGIKKTVLLQSSLYSKLTGTPQMISLAMVGERPEQAEFTGKGNIPVGVLLEGNFHSMYENRVLPFDDKTFQKVGSNNKMIVISDGDIVKNQLDKNYQPLELGYDKWTNKLYSNKEFLMNCVNYLLDDNGLINIRNKEVKIPLLDREKVYDNYFQSQALNVGLPLLVLGIFGIIFTFVRRRSYAR